MIHQGGDPATRLAIAERDKSLNFGIVVKRVAAIVEQFFLHKPQRRYPVAIVAVQVSRQIEKEFLFAAVRHGEDFQMRHNWACGCSQDR